MDAKQRWLSSREHSRWMLANRFDSKAHRCFYSLAVNAKLETIIVDKKLKAQGITDMGQLLMKISKSPSKAAYIAVGAEAIRNAENEVLVRICDPYYSERDKIKGKIVQVRDELNREETRSLFHPTITDIKNQQLKLKAINSRLTDLEKELASLPSKNTLPNDLYHWPSTNELIKKDLVTMKHPKAPKLSGSKTSTIPYLTDRGKKLYDASVKLAFQVDFWLKTGWQINVALIQQIHTEMQESYRECLRK